MMTFQAQVLIESKAGWTEREGLIVNPFYGRTLEEIRSNLAYAQEIYRAVFRYFASVWMRQGYSATAIQPYETLII